MMKRRRDLVAWIIIKGIDMGARKYGAARDQTSYDTIYENQTTR